MCLREYSERKVKHSRKKSGYERGGDAGFGFRERRERKEKKERIRSRENSKKMVVEKEIINSYGSNHQSEREKIIGKEKRRREEEEEKESEGEEGEEEEEEERDDEIIVGDEEEDYDQIVDHLANVLIEN
jgi:hypothetical protein